MRAPDDWAGAAAPTDPAAVIQAAQIAAAQQLQQQGGSGGYFDMAPPQVPAYSGPSADQLAAQQFAPQYQALDLIKQQAAQQYNTGYGDIGNMFNALADKTAAQADAIRGEYDATGQRVGAAYNQAMNSVSDTFSKNQSAIMEMLQRLGIGQAGGSSLGSMGAELTRAVGDIAGRQASRGAFNSQQGQNELDYNRRTADTNRLAGKNKQADLTKNYGNTQNDLALKLLDLKSGEAQAANQYGMSIQQMLQQQQQAATDNWFKQMQLGVSQANSDTERGRLAFDTQKWQSQMLADQLKGGSSGSATDPYSVLSQQASLLNSGNNNAAADDVDNVLLAYKLAAQTSNSGNPPLTEILNKLPQNLTPSKRRTLEALAATWYKSLGTTGSNVPQTTLMQYAP